MKKTTFYTFIVMLLYCGMLQAQTTKGRIMLGVSSNIGLSPETSLVQPGVDFVSMGFSTVKYKSDAESYADDQNNVSAIKFAPRIGYMIIDNLALGMDLNLSFTTLKYDDDDKTTFNSYRFGPFARYYFTTPKVLPYVEMSASFGTMSHDWSGWDEPDKYSTTSFGGGAGLAIPVGNHLTFDLMAGYHSFVLKDKADNSENHRTVIGTLGFKFGCTLLLGK